MIVLRIEHKSLPTAGGFRYPGAGWLDLPNPSNDQGIRRELDPHEVCAATPDKFGIWWPPEPDIAELAHAEGYWIVAIEVPDDAAVVGTHQVVFDRNHPGVRVLHEVQPDPVRGWLQ